MVDVDTRTWGQIDGVDIAFPLTVPEMNSATLTFTVPLAAAQALLPGDAFEATNMGGADGEGTAMLVLALADYVDNPWGDYNEVNFGLMVNPVSDPTAVGAFQWRMPVNQEFTCTAGNQVMGLPKTVEVVEFDYTDSHVSVNLEMDGQPALKVRLPRVAADTPPQPEQTLTYSYRDGVATRCPLVIDLPPGLVDPSEVEIELGTATVADELRSLGLPAAPDLAMWGEGLSGTFEWPEPLD